ncbi:MAG: CCA tRNA nucleotidyltransferase [Candidatus Gastranaerophilales bacterium]|nr:CCA tRNA nucleotidyltransferase [Candidatus Gastranaerophilales bacterium]
MYFNFDEKINNFLKIIVKCALAHGVNIYFVGGIVRDYLLGNKIQDIDLIVDKNAIEFVKKLPPEITIKSVHPDFCTVKVQYNNETIDIASTRVESYPHSGCLPLVLEIGVDIKKDYFRRDFTINAMYFKLSITNDKIDCELFDFSNGENDIRQKTLKVLHENSYIDDPTRILRGINFKNRFGFDFSVSDKKLINEFIFNHDIKHASHDRIEAVFEHVLSSQKAKENFQDIVSYKAYKLINPDIKDIDIELTDKIISKFSVKDKAHFYLKVIKNDEYKLLHTNDDLNILKFCSQLNDYEIAYYYYKTYDSAYLRYLEIKDIKLFVNGYDLINLGVEKGVKIGQILDKLLIEKINTPENFKTKEDEIKYIKDILNI